MNFAMLKQVNTIRDEIDNEFDTIENIISLNENRRDEDLYARLSSIKGSLENMQNKIDNLLFLLFQKQKIGEK